MASGRWQDVERLYHAAFERGEGERAAFLARECAGDDALRREVESLLACDDDAAGFLERSPLTSLDADAPALRGLTARPKRRDPFLWIVWASALAVLFAFSYATWRLVTVRGVTATIGWSEERRGDRWFVTGVSADGPAAIALQRGDRVVALNGRSPGVRAGTRIARRRISPGESYTLRIERDGVRHELTLTAVEGPNILASQVAWGLVSLVWCGIGLSIGFARPQQTVARLAFASAIATGLVFLQVGIIQSGPLWQPLHIVLGCHFFLLFARGAPLGRGMKAALVVLYVTGGASAFTTLWLWWMPRIAPAFAIGSGLAAVGRGIGLASYVGAVALMLVAIPFNYRRLRDEDQRRRVRWVIGCSVVGLLPQLWYAGIDVVNTLAGPTGISQQGLIVNAFTILIPISTAYAVLKHRVLGIRVVIRRGVQYLLARRALQVMIVIPVAALGWTAVTERHRTLAELVTVETGYLYWIFAVALTLRFRQPLRLALDRRFFREDYDRERGLLALVDDMAGVDSTPGLSRMVTAHLESAFHPSAVHLFYRERDEFALGHSSDPLALSSAFPPSGELLRQLERDRALLDGPRSGAAQFAPDDAAWLAELDTELIVPIVDSGDRLVGVLLLGDKKSGEPYSATDRRLLQAIARQTASVRETLQLRAEVDAERRIRHDVLERLDGTADSLLKECPACNSCYDGPVERCTNDGRLLELSLPIARTIDAKYRLERRIGQGGMGAVYEARDLRLARTVAVKILVGRAFRRACGTASLPP